MRNTLFNLAVILAMFLANSVKVMAFSGGDEIGDSLCGIVDLLSGSIGAAIASCAVIFLGIGAFFGKVTWGTALLTATAIIAIFGYDRVLDALDVGGFGISTC